MLVHALDVAACHLVQSIHGLQSYCRAPGVCPFLFARLTCAQVFFKIAHASLLFLFSLRYLLYSASSFKNSSNRIKAAGSMFNNLAILMRLSMSGWLLFVHHFEMVVSSLPSCSASHLFVRFFSTSTTFSLFKSRFAIYDIFISTKIPIIYETLLNPVFLL